MKIELDELHSLIVDYLRWLDSQTEDVVTLEEYRHYATALINFSAWVSYKLKDDENA